MKLVISVIALTIALVVKFVVFSPSNASVQADQYVANGTATSLNSEIDTRMNAIETMLVEMGFLPSENKTEERKLPQIGQQKKWSDMSEGERVRNLMNPDANRSTTKSRLPQIREPSNSILKMQSTY